MNESRLDVLLHLAREPQPADAAFVHGVMDLVRSDLESSRTVQRSFLRLAAAAVVVLLAGVAALVRSTGAPSDGSLQTTLGATTATPEAEESVRSGEDRAPDRGRHAGTAATEAPERAVEGERGYTSETTAYAVDQRTGLKLETEIYATEFDSDVPQQVTLTLSNTGSRPVSVYAREGCALMVAAYPAESGGDETRAWRCATPAGEPRAPGPETFVLDPGEERAAEATIVVGASGDWSVVGMCRCTYEGATAPDPAPGDQIFDDVGRFGSGLPVNPPPAEPAEDEGEGLVTPPLRVKAS